MIDADGDGHIHVREVIAAVNWAAAHLKNPADLLTPGPALPLAAINDPTPEAKIVVSSARQILSSLGKKDADAIAVEDTADTAKISRQSAEWRRHRDAAGDDRCRDAGADQGHHRDDRRRARSQRAAKA